MRRGGKSILSSVSFVVRPNEIVALLGSNGAGKTTLVDGILGITPIDFGTASIYGLPAITARLEHRVAACLQDAGLPHDLSVADAVRYYTVVSGTRGNAAELLDRHGISNLAARKVAVLSGGERRKLQVALAASSTAGLLILDEPTAALDVDARAGIWEGLVERVSYQSGAILFTTHLVEEAERYADRVVFLQDGNIARDEPIADLRKELTGLVVVRARVRGLTTTTSLPAFPLAERIRLRGGMVECHTRNGNRTASILNSDPRFTAIHAAPATLEDILFGNPATESVTR